MLVVKRLGLILLALCLMGQTGIVTPPEGIVVPVTPSSSGSAGAMSAACPPAEYLTQITSTDFTCMPAGEGPGSVPDSALVSAYSGVGVCPTGEFINQLTRNAAPTCATPAGGGPGVPSGTANQIIGYDLSGNPENQSISGGNGNCVYTRTNANAAGITCSNYATYGGGQFTGTVASPSFYVASGSGAPGTINAVAGSVYYQPGYNSAGNTLGLWNMGGLQGIPGISVGNGTAVLPFNVNVPPGGQYLVNGQPQNLNSFVGNISDGQLANAYSGIGSCPAGDVVTALARNGAPTCATISGAGGAPLVNPAGGQNNYAPLASPIFTGAISSPIVSLNSGTGGILSVLGAGIALGGTPLRANSFNIPTTGQYLINDAPLNFTNIAGSVADSQTAGYSGFGACTVANTIVFGLNRNAPPSCVQLNFNNLSGSATDAQLAQSYSGIGACPGGQFVTGLVRNNSPLCATPPAGGGGAPLVNPAGGQNNYAPLDNPTFTTAVSVPSNGSQGNYGNILFPSPTGFTGSITTAGSASNFLGVLGGAHYGNTWIADSTTPTAMVQNGQVGFYGGTGTIGQPWSPQMIGSFANGGLTMAAGNTITTPTLTVNGASTLTGIVTSSANINSTGSVNAANLNAPNILVNSSTGSLQATGGAAYFQPGYGGTVNLGTWNQAGLNNIPAIGIGAAAAPSGVSNGNLLHGTANGNFNSNFQLENTSAGANAYSTFYLGNDLTHYAAIQLGASNATANGLAGDSLNISTNAANGINIVDNGGNISMYQGGLGGMRFQATANGVTVLGQLRTQQNPSSQVTMDNTANTVTIGNGGNAPLPICSGFVIVTEGSVTGSTCIFVTGGGVTAELGGSKPTCSNAVAPPAGTFSVAYYAPANQYLLINDIGQTAVFSVTNICTRAAI